MHATILRLILAINNIAPLKAARMKNTSKEWFDREITEKVSVRDKLFKKFKSRGLNIDWEITKRQEITSKKKTQSNRKTKKLENIAKPNVKMTRATKEKYFSFEYMFKKQKWFIIRFTVNNRNL